MARGLRPRKKSLGVSVGEMKVRESRRQTEDGVDDVVCFFQCGGEVVCEGDVEVFELV
jgi:hypothetical protein